MIDGAVRLMPATWTAIAPILMLVASNVFMTFAWYGQLKVEHRPP